MYNHDKNIKKYQKSKNNLQCLGPCYKPGVNAIHPTHLEIISNKLEPFCPVKEWTFTDKKTGETVNKLTDTCFNPIEDTNISDDELQFNILTPYIDFTFEQFLKIYYNIFSFEDSIDWIDKNKFSPFDTKKRIMNASLYTFGENIDLFDNRFVDFFVEYIKKDTLNTIYKEVASFIGIKNDNIMFVKTENNNLNIMDNHIERINFLIKVFFDKEEITKFLMKYLKNRKKNWNEIGDHLIKMSEDITIYIKNKINLSI